MSGLKFKVFETCPNLRYGISERFDGAMELATADLSGAKNRKKYFERQGIDIGKTVSCCQAHSTDVVRVSEKDRGKIVGRCDGLVTGEADLFLTVTVADCFPVYFYNAVTKTIGLAHSGWRGTVANIADRTIKAMGGTPADILAGIGPGIGPCHFEIRDDILANFAAYPGAIIKRDGKIFVDLPMIIRQQLIKAGLTSQNIETLGKCTFCEADKYFSFRRDKPQKVQAMVAYIGRKNI